MADNSDPPKRKRPPGPGRGHKVKQGSGTPASGRSGAGTAGGWIGMPKQGAGARNPDGTFVNQGGGALGYARAVEIVQLPIHRPMVLDGAQVFDEAGAMVLVIDDKALPNVLAAAKHLMDRDFGTPAQAPPPNAAPAPGERITTTDPVEASRIYQKLVNG